MKAVYGKKVVEGGCLPPKTVPPKVRPPEGKPIRKGGRQPILKPIHPGKPTRP